mmetsp:Transcript_44922/g.144521  ORF Transcript_44922/g.144521 Transcript_44922/m.144521 type:complete len:238 (+) Transcript_44922:1430-2143(+)
MPEVPKKRLLFPPVHLPQRLDDRQGILAARVAVPVVVPPPARVARNHLVVRLPRKEPAVRIADLYCRPWSSSWHAILSGASDAAPAAVCYRADADAPPAQPGCLVPGFQRPRRLRLRLRRQVRRPRRLLRLPLHRIAETTCSDSVASALAPVLSGPRRQNHGQEVLHLGVRPAEQLDAVRQTPDRLRCQRRPHRRLRLGRKLRRPPRLLHPLLHPAVATQRKIVREALVQQDHSVLR